MAGKPSKVEQWMTGDGLSLLTSWKRAGLTDAQIAQKIGITDRALRNWKRKHLPISSALKKGIEYCIADAEEALISKFQTQTITEEKEEVWQDEDGQIRKHKTVTKKQVLPDTTAIIFFLKAKAGWHEVIEQKVTTISDERRKELEDFFYADDDDGDAEE